jgi:phosphate/sulfate permease
VAAAAVAHLLLNRRKLPEASTYLQRVKQTEPAFATLQIITACYMSFAHGANDVSHAAGPLATVVEVLRSGKVGSEVAVSPWLLAFGGVGIVVGLATYGYKVIATVGQKITAITPSRGFAAEFGCATTVLLAAKLGIPVSSSHTIVGAVVGVGLVRGLRSLDLRVLRDIGGSWVLTIPASGLLTALLYLLLSPLL